MEKVAQINTKTVKVGFRGSKKQRSSVKSKRSRPGSHI